ncbi:MAG: porin family protein [Saprospiraceae bacterium]|jgi:hypothetical protein|nr:PorT family protein [Saprospiraceae bacterium]
MNYTLKLFIIFILGILFSKFGIAQERNRFSSGVHAGMNFAQIDGDEIYGFNRFGFTAGILGRARIKNNLELGVEFKYSLRGSHYGKNDPPIINIKLNYLEVPVLFIVKDWKKEYNDKSFYKMEFLGGFSFGRLISASSSNGIHDDFKKFDFSWTAGCTYYGTPHWGYFARYTRAFLPIYRYQKNNQNYSMISYFLSLGLEYKF